VRFLRQAGARTGWQKRRWPLRWQCTLRGRGVTERSVAYKGESDLLFTCTYEGDPSTLAVERASPFAGCRRNGGLGRTRTCAKRAIQPASHRVDDRGCSRLSTEEGNTRPPRHRKVHGSRRAVLRSAASTHAATPARNVAPSSSRRALERAFVPAAERRGAVRKAPRAKRSSDGMAPRLILFAGNCKRWPTIAKRKQCDGCGQRRRPRARGGSNARERVPARRNFVLQRSVVQPRLLRSSVFGVLV